MTGSCGEHCYRNDAYSHPPHLPDLRYLRCASSAAAPPISQPSGNPLRADRAKRPYNYRREHDRAGWGINALFNGDCYLSYC
jgi:hypothetical protein